MTPDRHQTQLNTFSGRARRLCAGLACLILGGCASMAAEGLAGSVSDAILNQNDPATVRDGAPAFLLLLDGIIHRNPVDEALLIAGARLNGVYATVFVDKPERARRMTARAFDYAKRALCLRRTEFCAKGTPPYAVFAARLAGLTANDLPALYAHATAWAGWIMIRRAEWNAIADLPRLEAQLDRIVELNETFENGQAHLYLAVLRSQRPPALGGDPKKGRAHFERAIELSGGNNLMAKVEFAKSHARLVFDQALHDRLLGEVLKADPVKPGFTLSNTLAQREARRLLATSKDFF